MKPLGDSSLIFIPVYNNLSTSILLLQSKYIYVFFFSIIFSIGTLSIELESDEITMAVFGMLFEDN
jgi:hypothetical protein